MKFKSHILELMEMEMILWTIYMILDYQCMVANYLFNNFKCINFLTSCNWSSLLMWSSVKPKPLNCWHIIFLWWLHGKAKHQKERFEIQVIQFCAYKLIKHIRSDPLRAQKNDVQLVSQYIIILNLDGNFLTILNWSKKSSKYSRMCMTTFWNW